MIDCRRLTKQFPNSSNIFANLMESLQSKKESTRSKIDKCFEDLIKDSAQISTNISEQQNFQKKNTYYTNQSNNVFCFKKLESLNQQSTRDLTVDENFKEDFKIAHNCLKKKDQEKKKIQNNHLQNCQENKVKSDPIKSQSQCMDPSQSQAAKNSKINTEDKDFYVIALQSNQSFQSQNSQKLIENVEKKIQQKDFFLVDIQSQDQLKFISLEQIEKKNLAQSKPSSKEEPKHFSLFQITDKKPIPSFNSSQTSIQNMSQIIFLKNQKVEKKQTLDFTQIFSHKKKKLQKSPKLLKIIKSLDKKSPKKNCQRKEKIELYCSPLQKGDMKSKKRLKNNINYNKKKKQQESCIIKSKKQFKLEKEEKNGKNEQRKELFLSYDIEEIKKKIQSSYKQSSFSPLLPHSVLKQNALTIFQGFNIFCNDPLQISESKQNLLCSWQKIDIKLMANTIKQEIYLGEIKEKQSKYIKHGKGIEYCLKKYLFIGSLKDGKRNGMGRLEKENQKYVGIFSNGKFDGKGCLFSYDGIKYQGEFKNGLKSGKGVEYCRKGQKYEGCFKNNKRQGLGTLTKINGKQLIGYFADGLPVFSERMPELPQENRACKFQDLKRMKRYLQ